jgi:hypothetical protein
VLYEAVLNGGTGTVTFETWVVPQHYMTILKDTGPGGRLKVGSLFTSLPTRENVAFPNTLYYIALNHKHMSFITSQLISFCYNGVKLDNIYIVLALAITLCSVYENKHS